MLYNNRGGKSLHNINYIFAQEIYEQANKSTRPKIIYTMKLFLKILPLICYLVLFNTGVNAQRYVTKSEKLKPQWMSKLPKPSNATFNYVIITGEGVTLNAARANCLKRLAANEQLRAAMHTSSDEVITTRTEPGGSDIQEYSQKKIRLVSEDIEFNANQVDEYWELIRMGNQDVYRCHTLYAIASSYLPPVFDAVSFSKKYGARGFVRSIIPGWGQLYKGQKGKGAGIIAGEVVLIGGVIAAENLRASYHKKMKEQPRHAKTYNTKSDNWGNVRNVCIGAAAALYLYNLIDAAVSSGAKRTIVRKTHQIQMVPVACTEFTGIGLALKF